MSPALGVAVWLGGYQYGAICLNPSSGRSPLVVKATSCDKALNGRFYAGVIVGEFKEQSLEQRLPE